METSDSIVYNPGFNKYEQMEEEIRNRVKDVIVKYFDKDLINDETMIITSEKIKKQLTI